MSDPIFFCHYFHLIFFVPFLSFRPILPYLSFYMMCRWHSLKWSTKQDVIYNGRCISPGFILHTYDNKCDEWLLYYQSKLFPSFDWPFKMNVLVRQLIRCYERTMVRNSGKSNRIAAQWQMTIAIMIWKCARHSFSCCFPIEFYTNLHLMYCGTA